MLWKLEDIVSDGTHRIHLVTHWYIGRNATCEGAIHLWRVRLGGIRVVVSMSSSFELRGGGDLSGEG
jgi:hypothetical protein